MPGKPSLDRATGINTAKAVAECLGCSFVMLGRGRFAIVDSEDYQKIASWCWGISKKGYAITRSPNGYRKQKTLIMHRLILDVAHGEQVDHVNRVTWDNRKLNLRKASALQQAGNRRVQRNKKSSQFRGVFRNKWGFVAIGGEHGKLKSLGTHKSEIEAARAYNQWAKQHFGEFAYLNPV